MSEHNETTQGSRLPILVAMFAAVSVVMAGALFFTSSNPATPAQGEQRPARVPQGDTSAAVGWQVPDFDVQLLDADPGNITDYRGKVVFVNFWATWCVPCQREMPTFEELMASEPEDVVILAINHGETPDAVRDYRRLYGLDSIPIVMDENYEISDGFGVVNLPVTYVLDGEGVVRGFHVGEITRDEIDAYVADIRGAA